MICVRLRMLVATLLLIISTACNSFLSTLAGPAQFGQVPDSVQPTPRAPIFPRGRFSTVSAPDMVILSIEDDSSFFVFVDNDLVDSGSFEISGSQALVDSVACTARGIKPTAYNWLYDLESGLTFQPVATDPCPERRAYLSEQYVRKYMFVRIVPDRGWPREWLW